MFCLHLQCLVLEISFFLKRLYHLRSEPIPDHPPLLLLYLKYKHTLERIEYIEDIIEGLGNGRVVIQQDFDQLKTKLYEARAQIVGFQRKQVGHDDEIVLARVRTSTLEILIEDIQVRYRSDMKSLLDKIRKLKNHKGGPPDY
ncbi:hypothetical protein Tco_1555417 [Tanacetum coccineum]